MFLINQLAKQTDTPIATIRYYEQYGLFKGKKSTQVKTNNYTYYDAEVVEKLEMIKEAKSLGFSLGEIKTLVDAWYNNRLSIEKKKEILLHKIQEIDAKIADLKAMKKSILQGIKDVENNAC